MPELIDVRPGELLLDLNVRAATTTDPALVESIRDVGVLQPITVVRTQTGQYRVRYGNRRTLAAIEAEQNTVPVIVAGDEDDDQVERIVRQLDENERREALTQGDRVRAVQQLAAFGISPDQIAKRTRSKRSTVDAAVKVGASQLVTQAVDRYAFLDLEQAAICADFEDDPETFKQLVVSAERGHFDHAVQQARDARSQRAVFLAAAKEYTDAGITVVKSLWQMGSGAEYLDVLTTNGEPIEAEHHREHCPGHAILLEESDGWFAPGDVPEGWVIEDLDDGEEPETDEDGNPQVYAQGLASQAVCLDWQKNNHQSGRYVGGQRAGGGTSAPGPAAPVDEEAAAAEKEAAAEERRRVIRLNREWRSAEKVRRKFVQQLLTRKTAAKGSALFVARVIASRSYELRYALDHGHGLAVDLFGLTAESGWNADIDAFKSALTPGTSEARAQVFILGLVLAALDARTDTHTWRRVDSSVQEYFAFLVDQGYSLSEVESIAAGQETLDPPR